MVTWQLGTIICVLGIISLTSGQNVTTQWSTWFPCSESCFQGIRYRVRICASSDKNCKGSQTELCNTEVCNRTQQAFRDTACNATCNNTGWLGRSRYCLDGKPLNASCNPPVYHKCTGSCNTATTTKTTQPTSTIVTTTTSGDDDTTTWIAVGASAGFLVLLAVIVLICVCYKGRQKKASSKTDKRHENRTNLQVLNPEEPEMIEEAYGETIRTTEASSFYPEPPPVSTTADNNTDDLYALPKKEKTVKMKKERSEDAYNQLHGNIAVDDADYDTTNHVTHTMPLPPRDDVGYNEIDASDAGYGGEYDVPRRADGGVDDENEYEFMAGQTAGYSTLSNGREDEDEAEYNQLQLPTIPAAYHVTE